METTASIPSSFSHVAGLPDLPGDLLQAILRLAATPSHQELLPARPGALTLRYR